MKYTILVAFAITVTAALSVAVLRGRADDDVYPSEPSVTLGPGAADLKVGPKMNAAGRCMRDCEFVNQDLSGAVFDGCDLTAVLFRLCNLSGASFRGAVFHDAGIMECNINAADFSDATINGFGSVMTHLSEEQFKSTRSYRTKELANCKIAGARLADDTLPVLKYDFSHADLSGAVFECVDLRQCDFSDAWIEGTKFAGARITAAQLASTRNWKGRSLRSATFSTFGRDQIPGGGSMVDGTVDLAGMELSGINVISLALSDAVYTDAKITLGRFLTGITPTQLRSTKNYKEGDLSNMTFQWINFSQFDFSGQNLTGCAFDGCKFAGAKFDNAVITNSAFSVDRATRPDLTVDQIKSTWNYKHGRMDGIVLPKELADALAREKGTNKSP